MKKGYYIHFEGRTSIGVAKKIDMQMEEFRKYYEMREIEVETLHRSLLQRVIGLFPACSISRDYASALGRLEEPAFLYIRRTVADRAYVNFLRRVKQKFPKCKIIIEIFTYPYDKDDFGKWNAWPFYIKERIYRGRQKKYVDRFVTYTKDEEIFGVPAIQTINGINVDSVCMVQGEYREDQLTMIGVAYMQRQHGYERVIEGMHEYYSGQERKFRVYLMLVGDGPEKPMYQSLVEKYHLQEYVTFYPTTTGDELDRLYDKADVALVTFGAYKIGYYGMTSALKTRESLAKGIPMISGIGIDVLNPDFEYLLLYDNDDFPVDIENILEFYQRIRRAGKNKIEIAEDMRRYAYKKVSMCAAMRPIINFIEG